MHGKAKIGALVLLLLLCLAAVVVLAGGGVSIDAWLVIGGGGSTRGSAGNVSIGGALGQAIAGRSRSGPVDLQSGFWSGRGARSAQAHTVYVPVIVVGY